MARRLRQGESGWLKVWDETDQEWQRLESLLLQVFALILILALLLRFAYAAVGLTLPELLAALPAGLLLAIVLIAACSATARLCDPKRAALAQSPGIPALAALPWLLAALACAVLAAAALRYLAFDLHMGSSAVLGLPAWWQLALAPVIFLVMALRLLRRALRELAPAA